MAAAKKKPATKKPAKKKPTKKPGSQAKKGGRTQSEILSAVAARVELPKATVRAVLDGLYAEAGAEIKKFGVVTIPVLGLKLTEFVKAGHKKGEKYHNAFTGEDVVRDKATPAKTVVKVRALSGAKGLVD